MQVFEDEPVARQGNDKHRNPFDAWEVYNQQPGGVKVAELRELLEGCT